MLEAFKKRMAAYSPKGFETPIKMVRLLPNLLISAGKSGHSTLCRALKQCFLILIVTD